MGEEQTIKVTIDDMIPRLFERYIVAEKELSDMMNFIRENARNGRELSCSTDFIPKYIRRRYGLYPGQRHPELAWYLLDEYFKGNITIKEDAQPKP